LIFLEVGFSFCPLLIVKRGIRKFRRIVKEIKENFFPARDGISSFT